MYIADDEVRELHDGWRACLAARGEPGDVYRSDRYGMYHELYAYSNDCPLHAVAASLVEYHLVFHYSLLWFLVIIGCAAAAATAATFIICKKYLIVFTYSLLLCSEVLAHTEDASRRRRLHSSSDAHESLHVKFTLQYTS